MSTYAIGDIQGCFQSFCNLLQHCRFDPTQDRLWLVGDLVNRGPRSLETLRFIKSLGDRAITVLGNHDLSLLMSAEGFGKRHRSDTIDDILQAPDRDELLHWLRHRPLMHVEGDFALLHAGLLPQWSVAVARELAGEVEHALQADNYRDFLAHMWGSEPVAWEAHLRGWKRLRLIVNAFTRMRFCSAAGEMELKTKGEVEQAPAGYLPWFEVPGRRSADTVLVTGHWSALGLKITPNLLAIDSGCLWGGQLTAIRLEDRELFQVDCAPGEAVPLVKE